MDRDSILLIAALGGGFLVVVLIIACCVVCCFYRMNRRLRQTEKESKKREYMAGAGEGSKRDGPTSSAYSQDEGTTSSDYRQNVGATKWDGFDSNMLVHPEQYLSASQVSNSDNGSGRTLKYPMGRPMMGPNGQLGAATVTNSSHISHSGAPGNFFTSSGHSPNSDDAERMHQQRMAQHLMMQQLENQKRRLRAIVQNARNKLQLIDSKHIAFEYEVGRGKFGKVFRALWTDRLTRKQKTVAVKWFKQDEVNEEVFEDFLKEIAVAAHLPPNENVLQIFGFCVSPYALVTEFVNGGSVEICVSTTNSASRRADLCIGDIVKMFIDTAKGISHLHTVNIIHRDVAARNLLIFRLDLPSTANFISSKPPSKAAQPNMRPVAHSLHSNSASASNTHNQAHGNAIKSEPLMTPISEESTFKPKARVVVCDFGLSRVTQNVDSDNVTNTHVGPLKWMSPESIRHQIYNTKTDAYSFGIVMWEVLCGMPPYPRTKVLSLAVEVISRKTRPHILSWFPRPLQILMQRCWQENPEFRPSFEDIKNELEMFLSELMETGAWNRPLHTYSADELVVQGRTKERLRDLHELVDDYLNPNKYHWDRLIQPKLLQLIDKHNGTAMGVSRQNTRGRFESRTAANVGRMSGVDALGALRGQQSVPASVGNVGGVGSGVSMPRELPLVSRRSEPTEYFDDRNAQNSIEILKDMNVSSRVFEVEEFQQRPLQFMQGNSVRVLDAQAEVYGDVDVGGGGVAGNGAVRRHQADVSVSVHDMKVEFARESRPVNQGLDLNHRVGDSIDVATQSQ